MVSSTQPPTVEDCDGEWTHGRTEKEREEGLANVGHEYPSDTELRFPLVPGCALRAVDVNMNMNMNMSFYYS